MKMNNMWFLYPLGLLLERTDMIQPRRCYSRIIKCRSSGALRRAWSDRLGGWVRKDFMKAVVTSELSLERLHGSLGRLRVGRVFSVKGTMQAKAQRKLGPEEEPQIMQQGWYMSIFLGVRAQCLESSLDTLSVE
jgi:hypothetical protein